MLEYQHMVPEQSVISVIIPVYNHADELMETLVSLERQTERRFEVIVVDDGSTDGVGERLKDIRPSFPFQSVRFDQNRGADAARNEGFRRSTGSFLLFLDADIVLEPHALKKMARELESHPAAAFVYSSFYFGWKLFRGRPFDPDALKKENFIHTSSLLRREVFPGFDETLTKLQDWDLWLAIAERGGKGYWIEEVLFTVKTRKQGMSYWLPRIAYRIPWPIFGFTPKAITRYREAEGIIRQKHHLV